MVLRKVHGGVKVVNKLRRLITRKQKLNVLLLLMLMIISAFLEMSIVSLIIPLVSVIVNPNMIDENSVLSYFYNFFGLESKNEFLLVLVIIMIAGYLVKNSFIMFMYYVQAKFISDGQYKMSKKLLETFLERPYEYYLNASTGDLMRIVMWDASNVFSLINNVLSFLSELVVFIALVVLILVIDWKMTLSIAFIVGLTMFGSKMVFRKQLSAAGEVTQKYSAIMNKWLLQSFEGIKEVKISHREEAFVDQFSKAGKRFAYAQKKNTVISQAPRLLIETASMCGMLGFLAIMLSSGVSLGNMMAQIATLGMAAVRLMPSANRMNTYLNAISFLEPSLVSVYESVFVDSCLIDKKIRQTNNIKIKNLQDAIKLEKITYQYPNTSNALFENASMSIPVGKSVAIIGSSGAGKTTVVDIMLGLLMPNKGKITFDGIETKEDYYGWLGKIGYIPQTIFMLDDTIKNNIGFGLKEDEINEKRVWQVLEDAQLADYIKKLPDGIYTEIGEKGVRFSGGQRQRLGIARALYHNPEILVFDEATSALDNETESAIMESINRFQGEKTMIIIAHRLETIKDCDFVYRVNEGKIELQ